MLRGIMTVYEKLRPQLVNRPEALTAMDAQSRRFETEWLAAEARVAIETNNFDMVRDHLAELHARRGGPVLAVVRFLARWAPGMLSRVYGYRRNRIVMSGTPYSS